VAGIFEMSLLLSIFLIPLLVSIVIVLFFWYKDRYEREPLGLVLKMFLWGATSAVFAAIFFEYMAIIFLIMFIPTEILAILLPIIIAPLAEEYAKGRGILRLRNHEEYEGMMDGLVYGAAIGAGFGFTENLLYGLNALALGGLLSAVLLVVIRSSLEIVGHPFYTGWIGGEVGLEKAHGHGGFKSGYLAAVSFHGIWNSVAVIAEIDEMIAVIFFGIIVVCYGILLKKRINKALELDRAKQMRPSSGAQS